MKYIIKFLILLSISGIDAQCWNTTVPYNNTWSWMTSGANYPTYYQSGMSSPSLNLELPYYFTTFQNNGNDNLVPRFYNTNLDISPADGWVLISKNFGTPTVGSTNGTGISSPHFVLYNKFTGRVRVFYGLSGTLPGQTMLINTSFKTVASGSSSFLKSALFAFNEPIVKPLVNFNPNIEINTVNKHQYNSSTGNNTFWYYSEFMTAYDPCACKIAEDPSKTSVINITQHAGNVTSIDANINGTINQNMSVTNTSVGGDATGLTFGGVTKGALSGYESWSKYKDKYNSFYDGLDNKYKENLANEYWKDVVKKNPAAATWTNAQKELEFKYFRESQDGARQIAGIKNIDNYSNSGQVPNLLNQIKGVASYIPYVGAALGVIDALFGGDGGGQPMPPMNFDANLKLSGSLNNVQKPAGVDIRNPGVPATIAGVTSLDPSYDNILGVLHMLAPPEFEYAEIKPNGMQTISHPSPSPTGKYSECYKSPQNVNSGYAQNVVMKNNFYQYRIKTLPKIAINPHSGLEIEAVDAAFVMQYLRSQKLHLYDNSHKENTYYPDDYHGYYCSQNNHLYDYKTCITYQNMLKIPYYYNPFGNDNNEYAIDEINKTSDLDLEFIDNDIVRFRTPYVPLQCMQNINFTLLGGGSAPNTNYLKLIIKLKQTANPSKTYTMVLTYDVSNVLNTATKSTATGNYTPWVVGTNCVANICNDMNYHSFEGYEKAWASPLDNIVRPAVGSAFNATPGIISPIYVEGDVIVNYSMSNKTIFATGKITIKDGVTLTNCSFYSPEIEQGSSVIDPLSIMESRPVSIIDAIGCTNSVGSIIATVADINNVCSRSSYRSNAGYKMAKAPTPSKSKKDFTTTFSLQPNPARDYTRLVIDQPVGDRAMVKVYDMVGREVYSQEMLELDKGKTSLEISTQELHRGIYIVKVIHGELEQSLKLEVTK